VTLKRSPEVIEIGAIQKLGLFAFYSNYDRISGLF